MSRSRRGRPVDGILLLDKPVGISSNHALQQVKRALNARKAGHTGNLDVLASGLLPICLGEATKVCQFLLDADKRYRAEITFGRVTTTGDAEGETVQTRAAGHLDGATVEAAMGDFLGAQSQVPPMYSALKRNGQPLYKLAQQGIEVEREPRQITIHAFKLLNFEAGRALVEVDCSKGTYIRTLAEDLGEALGTGAFISMLRREMAGPFDIDKALTLAQIQQQIKDAGSAALDPHLLPSDTALPALPPVELSSDAAHYLCQGQAVQIARAPTSGLLRIYDNTQRFLGIGEVLPDGRISPKRLFQVHRVDTEAC